MYHPNSYVDRDIVISGQIPGGIQYIINEMEEYDKTGSALYFSSMDDFVDAIKNAYAAETISRRTWEQLEQKYYYHALKILEQEDEKMETEICDLNPYPNGDRNGSYGGKAGQKEGIIVDDQYWMIKYPKSTQGMHRIGSLSYNTSPISEYIGSHIYGILGYDVHRTMLGIRNGFVVVACRDFCDDTHHLLEFRELRNAFNKQLNEQLSLTSSLSSTQDNHFIPLDQVMVHLKYNPELQGIQGLQDRFWDCIIVDGLINNNDRNDGNWGILRSKTDRILAPVFDNGSSFGPNIAESKIRNRLRDDAVFEQAALNGRSAFSLDGERQAFFSELLQSDIPELQDAIKRVVPNVEEHMQDICDFITGIPEQVSQYTVISPERKEEYCKELICRNEKMLLPALARAKEKDQENIYN